MHQAASDACGTHGRHIPFKTPLQVCPQSCPCLCICFAAPLASARLFLCRCWSSHVFSCLYSVQCVLFLYGLQTSSVMCSLACSCVYNPSLSPSSLSLTPSPYFLHLPPPCLFIVFPKSFLFVSAPIHPAPFVAHRHPLMQGFSLCSCPSLMHTFQGMRNKSTKCMILRSHVRGSVSARHTDETIAVSH